MNRRITGHHLFVISFSLSLFLFFFLSLSFSFSLFLLFYLRVSRFVMNAIHPPASFRFIIERIIMISAPVALCLPF